MTAHTASATFDPSAFWAAPARDYRSSARLHLQHFLCQRTVGHLLSPKPPQEDSSPLRVADLGCGNGAWLSNLHDEFVKTGVSGIQLDGYDINSVHFPAPEFLPSAICLKQLDVLQPPEPELTGVYDVVHVRAFASTLAQTGVAPLLTTVLALLKPGGYFQWEEAKVDKFLIESPADDISSEACTAISQLLKPGQDAARGPHHDCAFVDRLDQVVLDHGFDDVLLKAFPLNRKQDYRAWTEDFLTVWGQLADTFPPRAQAPFAPTTREGYLALFRRAVAETERGVAIHVGKVTTVVCRKAV
ncbi:hypothetical protein PG996_005271 [Apiospora saccharicola]|uniref:Methyltransferase domain-containing protein n=1 Tax=Apiospora saccharicola TaxID=335842 RepID=A0ABR1VKZ7_9PEZI